MKKKLLVSVLLMFKFILVSSQTSYEIYKKFNELEIIDNSLRDLVDSLSKRVNNCDLIKKEKLFWSIEFLNVDRDSAKIILTFLSKVCFSKYIIGYFVSNEMYGFIHGKIIYPNFFKKKGNLKTFKFKCPTIPYPEDYTTWIIYYSIIDRKIIKIESFGYECN